MSRTVTRTISQPTASQAQDLLDGGRRMFVLGMFSMDWMETGAPPPIFNPPTDNLSVIFAS